MLSNECIHPYIYSPFTGSVYFKFTWKICPGCQYVFYRKFAERSSVKKHGKVGKCFLVFIAEMWFRVLTLRLWVVPVVPDFSKEFRNDYQEQDS